MTFISPRSLALSVFLATLNLFFATPPAAAGSPAKGPRLGYTHDKNLNQLHVGVHAVVAELTPNVKIMPSFEIGFGDGTLLALNGDVIYEFTELASGRWSYYAGGGPLLSRFSHSGRSSTDFALSLVVGATRELNPGRTLFGEVRLGLEDAPLLKITTGLTFF